MINLLKESEDQTTSINIQKSIEGHIVIDVELSNSESITIGHDRLTVAREDWEKLVEAMDIEETIEPDQKV